MDTRRRKDSGIHRQDRNPSGLDSLLEEEGFVLLGIEGCNEKNRPIHHFRSHSLPYQKEWSINYFVCAYFKNPEATAETLRDGWLHSGDVGELDQDGFLKITDRKKDLIITAGGKNIAPQNIENQLKFSPYINDAIVIGDRRKYLVALIAIDEENVIKFAQDNKIQFGTYASLTQAAEVKQLIQKEVDKVNKALANVEQLKKFTIIPKKLYEEDGEVTPTMKVKRKFINETYKDIIEKMYKSGME